MAHPLIEKLRALQIAAFMGGSVLCAGINNVILIAGDWLNIHYTVLLMVCYLASSSVGYAYHCRITFNQPMTAGGYINFVAGIWLGLPVSLALIAVMVDWLMAPMWVAAPVMTLIMFAYHYMVARLAIIRGLSAAD